MTDKIHRAGAAEGVSPSDNFGIVASSQGEAVKNLARADAWPAPSAGIEWGAIGAGDEPVPVNPFPVGSAHPEWGRVVNPAEGSIGGSDVESQTAVEAGYDTQAGTIVPSDYVPDVPDNDSFSPVQQGHVLGTAASHAADAQRGFEDVEEAPQPFSVFDQRR